MTWEKPRAGAFFYDQAMVRKLFWSKLFPRSVTSTKQVCVVYLFIYPYLIFFLLFTNIQIKSKDYQFIHIRKDLFSNC